jgi:hypothetical protein
MIGIPQGMQSAEQEERSRGGCKIPDTEVQDPVPPAFILFFSTTTTARPQHDHSTHDHSTTHTTPHHTAKERSGILDSQPEEVKKMGNNK